MAGQWLRARQTKYAAYATVYILVVLTIAVVANVLANRYNRSWDSTANKRYTLSDQTAKIVNDLTQDAALSRSCYGARMCKSCIAHLPGLLCLTWWQCMGPSGPASP